MDLAIDRFSKLVPDERKRKFYVRVFKWVVAFATWKYGAKSAQAEMDALEAQLNEAGHSSHAAPPPHPVSISL
jgi:hypothetical protein